MPLAMAAVVALLVIGGAPFAVAAADQGPGSSSTSQSIPPLVPTHECSCLSMGVLGLGSPSFQGRGPPNEMNFDEQIGITFAQNFTSILYNVTAVAQVDPTLSTGPAFLVNGLSDAGYWYQVGLSYNWNPGTTPGTGFDMNYEVFDTMGNSIYPRNGGGIASFSGSVNQGDTVSLNLYLDASTGQVVMLAEDLNTHAYAEQTFSSEGGSYFVGLPTVANANGFFTGLMTEWYHGAPYYADPKEQLYSTNVSVSSGWMWMDEFNPQSNALVFAANASAPASFASAPTTLQEFSYNGTTEYADAYQFATGTLNSTTSGGGGGGGSSSPPSPTQVAMTFSYSVTGGGTAYGPPTLTYVSEGKQTTVQLSTTPTVYKLDQNSQWSVNGSLPGSSSSERWVANGTTSGTAANGTTVDIPYQNQYFVAVSANDASGGSVRPSSSGWEDAGIQLQLTATPATGWKFEGWNATGQSFPVSTSTSYSLTVGSAENYTGVFYPGLVVAAPSDVTVTYTISGSTSTQSGHGSIAPGSTSTVYGPPSAMVTLTAHPTSSFYSFKGWKNVNSNSPTVTLVLSSPLSVAAVGSYNYTVIGVIVGVIALVVILALAALVMRRSRAQPQPAPEQTTPAGLEQPASDIPGPSPSS